MLAGGDQLKDMPWRLWAALLLGALLVCIFVK